MVLEFGMITLLFSIIIIILLYSSLALTVLFLAYHVCTAEGGGGGGGGRPLRRNNSNESFSSLSLAIKAMTRFGPSSYGNLQVRDLSKQVACPYVTCEVLAS
jgi:hypothetical protein